MEDRHETNAEKWSRKLGIQIGRGGRGYDEDIPQCPVCGCYGGGGHGGGCVNKGHDPKQWTVKP
jgi:hypothetical protein